MIKFKGLTITSLKRIALFLMLFDHAYTILGNVSEIFTIIGRISWPIFAFCFAEGIDKTTNKKNYMQRLYYASVGMAIIREFVAIITKGQVYIYPNIFITYHNMMYVICLFQDKTTTWKEKGKIILIWQLLSYLVIYITGYICITNNIYYPYYSLVDISGNIFLCEGGILYIIVGIILYYIKNSKLKLILGYTVSCCLFELCTIIQVVPRIGGLLSTFSIHIGNLFNYIVQILTGFPINYIPFDSPEMYLEDHTWLIMLGALPIMLLYNHNRGNYKRIFYYLFYPTHLILFYLTKYFCCI